MNFGKAIELTKQGEKVARKGWNGKNMYITYKSGYPEGVPANETHARAHGCEIGDMIIYDPYWEMRTATGSFVPWLASNSDINSNDWEVV